MPPLPFTPGSPDLPVRTLRNLSRYRTGPTERADKRTSFAILDGDARTLPNVCAAAPLPPDPETAAAAESVWMISPI